jgi:hypothetical protein
MLLYFTLSLNINCSRKQQKLEIKQWLHSLRLDHSLVCVKQRALYYLILENYVYYVQVPEPVVPINAFGHSEYLLLA